MDGSENFAPVGRNSV